MAIRKLRRGIRVFAMFGTIILFIIALKQSSHLRQTAGILRFNETQFAANYSVASQFRIVKDGNKATPAQRLAAAMAREKLHKTHCYHDIFNAGLFATRRAAQPSAECSSQINATTVQPLPILHGSNAQTYANLLKEYSDSDTRLLAFPQFRKEDVSQTFLKYSKAAGFSDEDDIMQLEFEANSIIRAGTSVIECGLVDHRIPQRYCRTRNVALNIDALPHPSEKEGGQDLPAVFGVLNATCTLDAVTWFGKGFGGGAAGWMFHGMNIMQYPDKNNDIKCDAWLNMPLFLISRWDTTNPFQFHQDALNTFITYVLLDLSPNYIQPVLLDRRDSDGPFTAAWSHIFTSSNRLLDIRQLAHAAAAAIFTSKSAIISLSTKTLCLSDAIWGFHGGFSPLARGGTDAQDCNSHALFEAFSGFMIDQIRAAVLEGDSNTNSCWRHWIPLPVPESHRLAIEARVGEFISNASRDNGNSACGGEIDRRVQDSVVGMQARVVTVTYAVRGSGRPPAESLLSKKQIQGVFDLVYGATMFRNENSTGSENEEKVRRQNRQNKLKRIITNDDEVQKLLANIVLDWSKSGNVNATGITAEFRAVDFAGLSFEDQIAVAQGTDVFVGPHGAVFAYLLYLRKLPLAAVVEIKPPERTGGNEQFRNLAMRMEHSYASVLYKGPTFMERDMKRLEKAVIKQMDFVLNERIALQSTQKKTVKLKKKLRD
ncbi:hypothetical protein HK100_003057 [Physocladia obscura]|uniref:Glycosyltransferase 61 catalytic domain-containing protein n=1 Tax=Physocladia obscura TaxID=109957 RepID=A0AAD5SW20_9FUNG|nr:hypothetical protein HK100_003057 [Physocladia obscura]